MKNKNRIYAEESTRIRTPNMNDFDENNAKNATNEANAPSEANATNEMNKTVTENFYFYLVSPPFKKISGKPGPKQSKRFSGHNAPPGRGGVPNPQKRNRNEGEDEGKDEVKSNIKMEQAKRKEIKESTDPPVIKSEKFDPNASEFGNLPLSAASGKFDYKLSWGKPPPADQKLVKEEISLCEKKMADKLAEMKSASALLKADDVEEPNESSPSASFFQPGDVEEESNESSPSATISKIQIFLKFPSVALEVEESPLALEELTTKCLSHCKQLDVNNEFTNSLTKKAILDGLRIVGERKPYKTKVSRGRSELVTTPFLTIQN